jgi:hypothetical protein
VVHAQQCRNARIHIESFVSLVIDFEVLQSLSDWMRSKCNLTVNLWS